jgi:hypothetical protein
MYDENATLECGCDGPYIYCGRATVGGYWSSRLADYQAFTLNNVLPGEDPDSVVLDCPSHEAKPIRIHFRFAPSGKISGTVCGPIHAGRKAV